MATRHPFLNCPYFGLLTINDDSKRFHKNILDRLYQIKGN